MKLIEVNEVRREGNIITVAEFTVINEEWNDEIKGSEGAVKGTRT